MRLQNITLATTVLLLGLNAIDTYNAQATTAKESGNTAVIKHEIAQTSGKQDAVNDDEMVDALQNRQDKINNLKELKNLQDKIESDSKNEEILDTLQESNFNVNSL